MPEQFSSKDLTENNKVEHHGFTGELGIGFVEAVSKPLKGAEQLAGYKVNVAPSNDRQQTSSEKTGYFIGSGFGNALLYIGTTALLAKVPGVGKQGIIAAGAALGFLNPTADGEGLETRAVNAFIGAGTNAIIKFAPSVFGKAELPVESFITSLKRNTLASGAAGLFNIQAESLLYTGRPAGLTESVNGTLVWAGSGAAFHTVGAAFRGRQSTNVINTELGTKPAQLSLQPSNQFRRTPQSDLLMAEQFKSDITAGVALQEKVGPWIAVLGSSAPKPGSSTYNSAYEIGKLVATKLKMPVGTGNGPGVMEAANKGAFDHKGSSIGIYLEGLPSEQFQNPFTTDSIRCQTLLARQHLLLSGAKGLVIAPEGGAGTVFEMTHQLIEMRRKVFDPHTPIVFVDDNTMWSTLRGWMSKNVVGRGLMNQSELDQTYIAHSPAQAIEILKQHLPQAQNTVLPFASPKFNPSPAIEVLPDSIKPALNAAHGLPLAS